MQLFRIKSGRSKVWQLGCETIFRPRLQELEARTVPADFRWCPLPGPGGGFSTLWSAPSNWQVNGPLGWDPTTVTPGVGDAVFFASDSRSNNDCSVDVVGGVTVKDVTIPSGYTSKLVLNNPLTINAGKLTQDSAGGAIVGYSLSATPTRGTLNITNSSRWEWTGGHISDITVNVANQSVTTVSPLTFTRNMSGSDIYVNDKCRLEWTGGPVNVVDPQKNSNIYIVNCGTFVITAGQTWGAVQVTTPSYFQVYNNGIVASGPNGTATIKGDYFTSGTTRISSGTLEIQGRAEQTSGTFELRNGSTVTVGGPDVALRIYDGSIIGTGTVNANLTLGYDGACPPPWGGTISPGIDTGVQSSDPNSVTRGIGTLTIVGEFQIFAGTMVIDVNASGQFDKVVVQGKYAAVTGTLSMRNNVLYKPPQLVSLPFLTFQSLIGDFTTKTWNNYPWPNPANDGPFSWFFSVGGTSYNFISRKTMQQPH